MIFHSLVLSATKIQKFHSLLTDQLLTTHLRLFYIETSEQLHNRERFGLFNQYSKNSHIDELPLLEPGFESNLDAIS
jgi:hypothetical protein